MGRLRALALAAAMSAGAGSACTKVVEAPPPPSPGPVAPAAIQPSYQAAAASAPGRGFGEENAAPAEEGEGQKPALTEEQRQEAIKAVQEFYAKKEATKKQVDSAISGVAPSLQSCFGDGNHQVSVRLQASPSGGAQNIEVVGAPPEAAGCVRQKLAAAPTPRFEGEAMDLQYNFGVNKAGGNPTAAAPPPNTPPPTFVQPTPSAPSALGPTPVVQPASSPSVFVKP